MRIKQIIIAVVTIIGSWYAMMLLHELGHCLGAFASGGQIENLRIPLMGFSRTDVSTNGDPLVVIWGGPVIGVLLPLLTLPIIRLVGHTAKHVIGFFVGFCLIANGIYIGVGSFVNAGDCRDLLHHGAQLWQLLTFGIIASASGLYIWHKMGPIRNWFTAQADSEKKPEHCA